LGAYVAESTGPVLAAVVVVQEIFGLNRHIRSIADDFASQGFWPSLRRCSIALSRISNSITTPRMRREACRLQINLAWKTF
jgi:hypothetical protein